MRNYEYLVAVASHGHFGRAAQECCVTQPTLSLGIKELERQLGFDLVRRERRYLGLTGEGEIVVDYAKRMLNLRSSLASVLEQHRKQKETPLVIGTVPSGVDMMAHFATRLCQLNLSQNFVTETVSKGSVARAVLDGEMDLGITHLDACSDDLQVLAELHDDQPYLVAPRGMQLDGVSVSSRDIQNLPVCHLSPDYYGSEIKRCLSTGTRQDARPRIHAGSVRSVVSYLEQHYWYAAVPCGVLGEINKDGRFWSRPIDTDAIAPRLAIVSRPISTYSGKKLEVIEYLRKVAHQYVDEALPQTCANVAVPIEKVTPLRPRKAMVQELIETFN